MVLTEIEISKILNTDLVTWRLIDSKIETFIKRDDLKDLGSTVKKIWDFAEKVDHHPDIFLTYSGIKIILFTHDESGVTKKDIDFARDLEKIY
ncbi:4a-hydroxytetrahydrobiopterin dehydratase [Nitrosomonadales bacterium]|nr:4a-hydroxytetrahydrobiopterin dehydratase [Nitrosomonadales bacterium]